MNEGEAKVTIEYFGGPTQTIVLKDANVEMRQDVSYDGTEPAKYTLGNKFATITGWVESSEIKIQEGDN